jgi:hypothetical protein
MRVNNRLLTALLGGAAVIALMAAAGCGGGSTAAESASPSASAAATQPAVLSTATAAVQQGLDALDADLAAAAQELATIGAVTGAEATTVLQGLAGAHPEVVDFFTQDMRGKVVAAEPQKYKWLVGTQGMSKADADQLAANKQPLLSATVTAEEGFLAAALVYPVIKADGTMVGGVAAFLNTDEFLGAFIDPIPKPADLDKIWAMDTQANNLYDPDKNHSGRNMLTDAHFKAYPDLLALSAKIAETPTGHGQYTSPPSNTDDQPIVKDTYWDSVALHGTEWRIIAAFVAGEQ